MEEPHLLFIPDNNNTQGGESGESALPAAAIATIGVSSIVPLVPGQTALDLPTTPNNTYAKDPDKNDNDDDDHDYDDNSDNDGKGGDDEYIAGEDDDDDDDDDNDDNANEKRKGKKPGLRFNTSYDTTLDSRGLPSDFEIMDVGPPLNEEQQRHRHAFYIAAMPVFQNQATNNVMMTAAKYKVIIHALFCIKEKGNTAAQLHAEGYTQIYNWVKKFDAIITDEGRAVVLVERPQLGKKKQGKKSQVLDMDKLRKLTYFERLYADILAQHHDHNKGNSLYKRVCEKYSNVSKTWTLLFTKTCPGCIERAPKPKPIAGLKNIITCGFGVRGQVDLIDFQSMPDGSFKYLLNYINHALKILFSVPIVAKRATCIAYALFNIFCQIGPPMILQADNGREFSSAATTSKQRRNDRQSVISDKLLSDTVTEVRKLWPDCKQVMGTPRHSESNGGVERVNQTVQQKLHAWMKRHNSTAWSVGCKMVQWQINTQFHETIKDTPYRLTYGQTPRIGISDMPLDPQFLSNLQTEEELNKITTFVNELEATLDSFAPEVAREVPISPAPEVDEVSAIESEVHVSAAEGVVTVNDHTPQKAFIEEIGRSSWENNFLSDMELFGNVQVPLNIFLDGLRLREQRAVMWSLQDTDDHSDVRNFVPGYLKKVATNVFEVVDDKNDVCFATATVDDPEDGLINLWGTVLKLPTEEFVEHCKENSLFFDGSAARLDGLDHDVTPGRRATREKAALMMNQSARKVLKRVKSRTATLSIGDVVQVPLVQQDRAKVDAQNLTGVVVRVNDTYGMCQVAVYSVLGMCTTSCVQFLVREMIRF